ncbi:periplasmic component of amino acid ABC-type transporter/signal transduction system [Xenococcus sp. PCC 7305]|uniref:transporter substrate-binding domain-containing protein n=1 Tax=Xenococcus sp. PCC 7305 TaxID=102125 RepID=UPI0002AC4B70|nr:transporter substrate-binding domain-containing protein [Xenococcus sp. PCC 7305]ELS02130.1 periplasmic component of amino acid ABC-type transporter/signal transduction system [Xenococcus sp. PCC 7305]
MNKRLQLAIISCGIAASVIFPQICQAKTVEEEIEKTGILNVGIREDSPLFGFSSDKVGYCADFANSLAENLSQKLDKTITVNLIKSTTQTRWDLVKDGTVHLECGPNTITPEREQEYGITFSKPFFVTATQVFVRIDATEESLRTGTIGIIKGTTNEAEIRQVYPEDQVNDSFKRRSEGIAAVQLQEISGFASDGILLEGTASFLEINPEKYTLVTPLVGDRPLCAAYGMILPEDKKNTQWHDTVNSLIAQSGQGEKVWENWFRELLPYVGAVLEACQADQESNNNSQDSTQFQSL